MRIKDCIQGSEEWWAWRNRPTASQFDRILTPKKLEYATGASSYAYELATVEAGLWTEPTPSFWMAWGTENEPNAVASYEAINGVTTQVVGFCLPDGTDSFGGSPDRLVGEDGLLETKCLAPQTLIKYTVEGVLPSEHMSQVQGLLLITGREWCDFFCWHPKLAPFQIRVFPDLEYQEKLLKALAKFLVELERVKKLVVLKSHEQILFPGVEVEVMS